MDLSENGEGGIWVFDEVELPDGWVFDQLGNRCTVRRGASPRPAGHPRYFGSGTIPWIKIGDATNTGSRFIEKTAEHVNEEGAKCSVHIPAGSLIIANSGVSLGFAAITRVPGCIHDGWLLTTDFRELDRDYLYYCINVATRRLRQLADGTTQPNLNTGIARRLMLPLPPLAEQKAIAAVLGALDDKIELNRRMNATLEAMARALFQSWFVDFDPVRAKLDGRHPEGMDIATAALFPNSFQDSALGQIPKGWEVRDLDKIAHYLNGLALQKYPPGEGFTLPVIKITQLRKGDSSGADRCNINLPTEYIVHDGDVLFSWSGSLEVELWCGGTGALNQHLFKVTSSQFPKWFYYLWTVFHLEDFRLIAADKATTMGHIQRGHLTAAKVLIPPSPMLDAMTAIMLPLVDQLIANRIQSRTLAVLRDTLLPKLLSGKLSLGPEP